MSLQLYVPHTVILHNANVLCRSIRAIKMNFIPVFPIATLLAMATQAVESIFERFSEIAVEVSVYDGIE